MTDSVKFLINTEVEVPVNLMPLVDSTDFSTVEDSVSHDALGMSLSWNFLSASGERTFTDVIPSAAGNYQWVNGGSGMYSIVIPSSGGDTINNDASGFGWFVGKCDGVLAWRGPIISFVSTRTSSTVIYTGDEPPDEPVGFEVEGISGWEEVNALSLYRYARILNINPVHLSTAGNIKLDDDDLLFPLEGQGRFYQHKSYFQGERVSREEIIEEIAYAESAVEDFLGTFVAPKWTAGEKVDLQKHYNPLVGYDVYDVRNNRVRYSPQWGKFISGGQRGSSLIAENVDVVYSDPDGDGWNELATISFDLEYSGTSLYELKVFFTGYDGAPQYEIRPPLTKSKSGVNVEITFETWKLINPVLYERYPTQDMNRVIDLLESGNIVTNVDIYRKFNSANSSHATFYYTTSDNEFEDSTQGGYIKIADPKLNLIQIIPATYGDGVWAKSHISGKLRYIELNYLSGFRYRPQYGTNFWDELHPDLAQIIAYIATSRLSRPLAGKPDTVALSTMLQKDYAETTSGTYRYATEDVLKSPFGTRAGEVMAWRRLQHFQHKFMRH